MVGILNEPGNKRNVGDDSNAEHDSEPTDFFF